ncbi:MAG: ABC transporter ATP-binding protein, partial [Bacteroidetes bacterium]|nr:ABC transporter ATP-binding protein [Bacteroidota bacterium]
MGGQVELRHFQGVPLEEGEAGIALRHLPEAWQEAAVELDDDGKVVSITIDGQDIREFTLDSLRHNVGIVQQDVFLFSANIHDNIAYGVKNASREDVVRAATVAQLHDHIESLPDGYDTWVGERGATLSGG